MKIVDVCEFYSPTGGGVRSYVHQKLEFAARLGHDLTIVAPGRETKTEDVRGGRISWVKSPYLPVDRNYRMFWRSADVWTILDRHAPDIVEGSSTWRGGWIAGQWQGTAAKILFMHSDPVASYPQNVLGGLVGRERVDRVFGWFWSYLRRLDGHFDATLVTGEWLARRFSAFGLKHVEAIPLGIDREAFSPDRRDAGIRRAMLNACGLGEDAALLVAVGRHHPEKRFGMLVKAVSRAQRKHPIGLYIIGDGLLRRSVESWAARARHVHVAGQVDDLAKLSGMLASADALVHGCASETFGLVVAEALCSGTPVVVPGAGGAAELVTPACGGTYRAGDAVAAATAILDVLARDREIMSRACIDTTNDCVSTVEQHFSRLFAFYEKIAKTRAMRLATE